MTGFWVLGSGFWSGVARRPGQRLLLLAGVILALAVALFFPACGDSGGDDPESRESPLTAEQQLHTFTLPEGFEIELVAADPDMKKVVDISFDEAGRMWAVTASEYPLDQNDEIEAIETNNLPGGLQRAVALAREQRLFSSEFAQRYRRGGRDHVLVFDTPTQPGRQTPRIFADGMFLPLSVLQVRDGVLVCQGPDILLLQDSNGDGQADQRKVVLTGFGVQDSHNNQHRLTRGPGGWIYFAQGGFTFSNVQTPEGSTVRFDATKVARARQDGTEFEIFSTGLLNIWGFVIDRLGELWISESNDVGYPVVPVSRHMSYPGIGRHRTRPYTPWHPPTADFRIGGTGLSGLAVSGDPGAFPAPFDGAMLLANPITRTINSVRVHREGADLRLEKGPNLVESSDPWFRPVALYFGPDGALYIVDWYNKIISHNEVSRTHPDRDKARSRIWRVRHRSMHRSEIPDLTRVADSELLNHLRADITWEARAAWHQIADRKVVSLAPDLEEMLAGAVVPVHQRLLALWSLEELGRLETAQLQPLLSESHRALRREAVRVLGTLDLGTRLPPLLQPLMGDPDPGVRSQVIHALDAISPPGPQVIEFLLRMVKPPLEESGWVRTLGVQALRGASYRRAFERSLLRAALEEAPDSLRVFLNSPRARVLPLENRLLGRLALGDTDSALRLLGTVPNLGRNLSLEELMLIVSQVENSSVRKGFANLFRDPKQVESILHIVSLFSGRVPSTVRESTAWSSLLVTALRGLLARSRTFENEELLLRLVSSFRLEALEDEILAMLRREGQTPARRLSALSTLLEIEFEQVEVFQELAGDRRGGRELRRTAITALASAESDRAMPLLLQIWNGLDDPEKKLALTSLTSTPAGSRALLAAIEDNEIHPIVIDTFFLERITTVLGPDYPGLQRLQGRLAQFMEEVLQLPSGRPVAFSDTNIVLEGPFTVESWLRLEEPIQAGDGLLGDHVSGSFNFHEGVFRVTLGSDGGDLIVATTPTPANQWFHVAVTRDEEGRFRIYFDGALNTEEGQAWKGRFKDQDIGRTQSLIYSGYPGTSGMFSEFRVWNLARSADEIWENYQRSFKDSPRPPGLVHYFHGDSWGPLARGAQVVAIQDFPLLLTEKEALARIARFEEVQEQAARRGDLTDGKAVFKERCMVCHQVGEEGENIGPVLDGAAVKGLEALVRSVLTPNAGVEPGYRTMRVITTDNQIIEGFLAEESDQAITLRQQRVEDTRVPQENIKRAYYLSLSVMPEGLLDDMTPREVSDLFNYLQTLK